MVSKVYGAYAVGHLFPSYILLTVSFGVAAYAMRSGCLQCPYADASQGVGPLVDEESSLGTCQLVSILRRE